MRWRRLSARSSRNAWQRLRPEASAPIEKAATDASPSAGQSGRTSMETSQASANGETARDGRPLWTARFRSRQTRTGLRTRQTAGETGCRCERRWMSRPNLREQAAIHRAPSDRWKVRRTTGPRAGESGVGSNAGPICYAPCESSSAHQCPLGSAARALDTMLRRLGVRIHPPNAVEITGYFLRTTAKCRKSRNNRVRPRKVRSFRVKCGESAASCLRTYSLRSEEA